MLMLKSLSVLIIAASAAHALQNPAAASNFVERDLTNAPAPVQSVKNGVDGVPVVGRLVNKLGSIPGQGRVKRDLLVPVETVASSVPVVGRLVNKLGSIPGQGRVKRDLLVPVETVASSVPVVGRLVNKLGSIPGQGRVKRNIDPVPLSQDQSLGGVNDARTVFTESNALPVSQTSTNDLQSADVAKTGPGVIKLDAALGVQVGVQVRAVQPASRFVKKVK